MAVSSSTQAAQPRPAEGLAWLTALIANAAVLLFYFYYDLSLTQLVFVYWWECAWVGLFAWLKLLAATLFGSPYESPYVEMSRGASLFATLLLLCFVGTKYFTVLIGLGLIVVGVSVEVTGLEAGAVIRDMIDPVLAIALVLLVNHALLFVYSLVLGGGMGAVRWLPVLGWSYARLGTLAVAMACGLLAVAAWPSSAWLFAAVIVAVKIAADCVLTRLEATGAQQREP
jgi:Family of unknown function (DUF6498)